MNPNYRVCVTASRRLSEMKVTIPIPVRHVSGAIRRDRNQQLANPLLASFLSSPYDAGALRARRQGLRTYVNQLMPDPAKRELNERDIRTPYIMRAPTGAKRDLMQIRGA